MIATAHLSSAIRLSFIESQVQYSPNTFQVMVYVVSSDGDVVVWLKCVGDYHFRYVWRAERTLDAWNAPKQVTGTEGYKSLLDTNGPVTVYGSTADINSWSTNIRFFIKSFYAHPPVTFRFDP